MDRETKQARKLAVRFVPITAARASAVAAEAAQIDPWARHNSPASALRSYLTTVETDAPRFAILADNQLAGAMGVRKNWLRGPYLQFLVVLPAFQGTGVGRTALAWLEGEARAVGAQNLWVAASDFNTRAIAFYEAHGFQPVANLDDLVSVGMSEVLFRKRLEAI